MPTPIELEKIREIDLGIESAKRFENDLLRSGEFSQEEQAKILSASDQGFTQILESRGFKDTQGLARARQDYFHYRFVEPPKIPGQDQEKEEKQGINPADAAGALLGLGLTPFMREKGLTPELFESLSRNYAEKAAIEWNKTKDLSKARSYLHAYEIAQQDYFDRFAYSDPKRAKQLANFRTQKLIDGAILRNKLLKEKGVKGFAGRSWTPNYEQAAQNRLRMIDKLSEMKAKNPSTTKDIEREKLLRAFADDDPATFQHHINSQREQGKTLDPLMQKVIADKISENARRAKRLAIEREKHTQQAPETPKNPGRISRLKTKLGKLNNFRPSVIASRAGQKFKNKITGSKLGKKIAGSRLGRLAGRANRLKDKTLGKLNNLRPSSIAPRTARKVGRSILSFLTNLLKRSLIGGVIGAISSFLSTAISVAIGIGTAIGTIIGIILTKLTLTITALLSISITALAGIVALICVIGIFAVIIFLLVSILPDLFPSPSPGIAYTIEGPEKIENGGTIHNRIGFFYFSDAKCSIENIVLIDTLPPRSNLVSATGNKTTTPDPLETVKWKISENSPALESPQVKQYVFDVYHKPQDNITATSRISLEGCDKPPEPFSCAYYPNDLTCGADDAPSSLDCDDLNGPDTNGSDYIYSDVIPDLRGKLNTDPLNFGAAVNFGDPKCSFSRAKLEKLIEEREPVVENRELWMKIADCRSLSMGPNAYISTEKENGKDVERWGLFGMNRSKGENNFLSQTDRDNHLRGDVPWQKQVINAIAHNNDNGGKFNLTKRWEKCLNK